MRLASPILLLALSALPGLQAPGSTAPSSGQHDGAAPLDLAVGNHFTIAFDGPEQAATAARALETLDRAYWRIGSALNTYPPQPVPVVLYTAQQFRDVTRAPEWAAGSYDGTIRVPMLGALEHPAELDRVMAHEFTHALVRTIASGPLPMWLEEGIAAAFERESIDWARSRVREAGGPMPLQTLTQSFGRFERADAELAYATSALAVRAMLDADGGVAVSNVIRDVGHGESVASAFTHRMHQSFAQFAATFGRSN